jgi:hypothetical protein
VAEKEREFLPVGLTTRVSKDSQEDASKAAPVSEATGTVTVATNPDGADVFVDGQFYGNSPATLKLKPGKHTIGVKMSGYKDWSRDMSTDSGGESHLTATLDKS